MLRAAGQAYAHAQNNVPVIRVIWTNRHLGQCMVYLRIAPIPAIVIIIITSINIDCQECIHIQLCYYRHTYIG